MKKRVISFLLSLILVLGLFVSAAPDAAAAYDMEASEEIIALIKSLEGFADRPYQDNGQWSVGYGSAVTGQELTKYQAYGITDTEADQLLRRFIAEFETDINAFAKKYSLELKQQQFDALVSFTYNLGPNWMNNDSTFRQAVIEGKKGSDFLFAITRWCTANDTILASLAKRRLIEANVYLNGVYSSAVPSNYRYVIFDNNIGNPVTNAVRIQGFDINQIETIRSTPSKSGYRFLGWYTKAAGGEWVETLTAAVSVDRLYAHWQNGNGEEDADGNVIGTAAQYKRTITASSSKIVREDPSNSAAQKKQLTTGDKVSIVADYMDSSGSKWGKLSGGGWLNLDASASEDVLEEITIDPMTITVLTEDVNIRCGPGTNYYKTGKFAKGEKLVITAVQKGGQYLWGKSDKGWICLHYTDYDLLVAQSSEGSAVVTATGVIVKTNTLNIRNGPGTKYEAVGKYQKGDQVQITLQEQVGSTTWGLTEKGWISLYYVELTPVTEQVIPDTTEPAEPEVSTEPETPAESEKEPEQSENQPIATGTVNNCTALNVREGAGTKYDRIGRLVSGTRVEIYEQTKVKGETWGRTAQGWICMTYVELDAPVLNDPQDSESDSQTNSSANAAGTVVKCSYLNVRSGAGTDNPRVTKLAKGTAVTIYETVKVGSSTWGRMDQGWVHMYYIKLDASGTAGGSSTTGSDSGSSSDSETSGSTGTTGKLTGTVVKTDKLRVRSAAGVKNAEVGTITGGSKVTIYETTKVGTTTWGHISKGWISLYYVELDDSAESSGSSIRTVMVAGLRIRSGPGTNNTVVASYNKGTRVEILEETLVDGRPWGRTNKGWISLDYVQ